MAARDFKLLLATAAAAAVTLSACSKKGETRDSPPSPAISEAKSAPEAARLSAVEQSLAQGDLEAAAAQLLKMRLAQAQFDAVQASRYRQLSQDAYMRAVEGAGKGDPKAQAALQLLRASRLH